MRLLVFLGCFFLAATASAAASVVIHQHNWHYSGALPLSFSLDKWSAPITRRDDFTEGFSETRLGAGYNNFSVTLVKRYEVSIAHSADFMDLLFATKKKQDLDVGRQYQLWLKANILEAQGVRLAYDWQVPRWGRLHVAYNYLQAQQYYHGYWQGRATALSNKDYDFELDVDYVYSKDILFERRISKPQGEGYSVDLGYQWHTTAFELDWLWSNALSEIRWQGAARTTAKANSNTKQYDESGYVKFLPVLSGRESYQLFRQPLPERQFTQVYFVAKQKLLGGSLLCTEQQCYPHLLLARRSPSTHYELSYGLRTRSPGLRIIKSWMQFHLEANDDWRKATQFSFLLSLQGQF